MDMYKVQALMHAHSKSKETLEGHVSLRSCLNRVFEVFFCIFKKISFLLEYDNESGTFELASIKVVHYFTLMFSLIDLREL